MSMEVEYCHAARRRSQPGHAPAGTPRQNPRPLSRRPRGDPTRTRCTEIGRNRRPDSRRTAGNRGTLARQIAGAPRRPITTRRAHGRSRNGHARSRTDGRCGIARFVCARWLLRTPERLLVLSSTTRALFRGRRKKPHVRSNGAPRRPVSFYRLSAVCQPTVEILVAGGDLNPRPLDCQPLTAKPLRTTRGNKADAYWVNRGRGATPDHPEPRTIVPVLCPLDRSSLSPLDSTHLTGGDDV